MSNAHFYIMNISLIMAKTICPFPVTSPKSLWFWPYFNLNFIINYNVSASAGYIVIIETTLDIEPG